MDFAEQNKLKSIENMSIHENPGFNLTHNQLTIYK